MRTNTIFIVNDSGHNLDPAKEYSDKFVVLTYGKVNIFSTDRVKTEIEQKIAAAAQPGDMLLLSGNAILNVLASLALMSKIGEVSFLLFNFNRDKYEKRKYHLADFNLVNIEASDPGSPEYQGE